MAAHTANGHAPTQTEPGLHPHPHPGPEPPAGVGPAPSETPVAPPVEVETNRTSGADEPPADDIRAAAQAIWRADPTLTGAALAERFGMSERWGRMQIAAARNGNGNGTADRTADGTSGSDPARPYGRRRTGPAPPAASRQPADGKRTGTPSAAPTAQQPRAGNGTPGNVGAGRRRAAPRAGNRQTRVESVPLPEAVRRLVRVTVVAVAVVTVVAMVHSFVHTRDLAVMAGWSAVLAWTLPLAVDGLVVAGSTSLLVDHHLDRRCSPLAWAAVVIGLSSSMAANVVAVDPTLIDLRVVRWVMAGYAPVACAISGHLLLRMASGRRPGRDPRD